MKLASALILCFGLSAQQQWMISGQGPGPTADNFTVEKLTPDQVAELKAAQEEAARAQAKLEAAERKVKEAHGALYDDCPTCAVFHTRYVNVEIRGDYALISTHFVNSQWGAPAISLTPSLPPNVVNGTSCLGNDGFGHPCK